MQIIMKKNKIENILENNLIPSYEINNLSTKIYEFIDKYEKSKNYKIESNVYLGINGSILVIITKQLEIRIFTAEEDFLQYFGPFKKLNQIEGNTKENLVVNKLYDFDSELNIIVEERLIKIEDIICNVKSDLIKKLIVNIIKTFFRTIFLLYLKNDQVDFTLSLKNFGIKQSQLVLLENNDFDNIRILSYNFINTSYLHTPVDTNKVDNFIAKRCLFESFKNFRDKILIKLHNCGNYKLLIDNLKNEFKVIDNILTFEYETDKVIKGRTEYIVVKSFKFLNIDDIISLIKKKLI
tara:strand:+ start:12855 stop:13739 length:885 start_codon:yes stop_codon:yes gene_type:complete